MKEFASLYQQLDETTKTNRKVEAMRLYFENCDPADGAWAVYFLSGRRLKRLVQAGRLREFCAEISGIPDWLFEESYGAVGDLAETIALLLPPNLNVSIHPLNIWIKQRIQPLSRMDDEQRREALSQAWTELSAQERFVFNKLVTGGFRVGVSQGLVVRALSQATQVDKAVISHRLMGSWEPTPEFFNSLSAEDDGELDRSRPYPFALAHPLQQEPETIGEISEWMLEWKWDGIRAQIIRREGETFIWSRGEELIHERFPELLEPAESLPDGTVIDGEILAWKAGEVQPFSQLQRRIGRKKVGKKLLTDVPCSFIAFDILEAEGHNIRSSPLEVRRKLLESLIANQSESSSIIIYPQIEASSWEECLQIRNNSREKQVEGLMLKRRDSDYGVGRLTNKWWKWKVDPYSCDAVLIYAQRGHGRRASLHSDYTFAAWDNGNLVPFAKAYSGLTDAEIREVDRFVRKNTLERFGPVRSVKPELVFELAFENIQRSNRHKSGIAVRFPRMVKWRHDKKPADADTLDMIRSLVPDQSLNDEPAEARKETRGKIKS